MCTFVFEKVMGMIKSLVRVFCLCPLHVEPFDDLTSLNVESLQNIVEC